MTGGELSCPKPQDEARSIYCSLEVIFQVKEQYFSNINEKFQSAEGNGSPLKTKVSLKRD